MSYSQYAKGGGYLKVRVICSKCQGVFEWRWGKTHGICEICDTPLTIREVKMAPGEFSKLLQTA